jgi:hypothetical protein
MPGFSDRYASLKTFTTFSISSRIRANRLNPTDSVCQVIANWNFFWNLIWYSGDNSGEKGSRITGLWQTDAIHLLDAGEINY